MRHSLEQAQRQKEQKAKRVQIAILLVMTLLSALIAKENQQQSQKEFQLRDPASFIDSQSPIQSPNSLSPNSLSPACKEDQARCAAQDPNEQMLDISQVKPVKPLTGLTPQDVAQVIPTNMGPTEDQSLIGKQVLDNSINNFFNGKMVQSSAVGKAASSVQNAMHVDMALNKPTKKGDVEHKMNIQFNAFQQAAMIQYSGLLNANMKYIISTQTTDLELVKNVSKDTSLVVNHQDTAIEDINRVSMRYNW